MMSIERSAFVMHSAKDMYSLVSDIDSYPEFLPWCIGARVLSQSDTELEGELEVKKGPLHFHLATKNTMITNERIDMALIQGTFHHLEGDWVFKPLREDACKTTFRLQFELVSVVDFALELVLKSVATTVLEAFCERADKLYVR